MCVWRCVSVRVDGRKRCVGDGVVCMCVEVCARVCFGDDAMCPMCRILHCVPMYADV